MNLAGYLHTANDPLIAVVVKHQKWLECSKQRRTVLKEARLILRSHGIELEPEMWLKTDSSQNSVREWRRVARELREAQTERLKSNLPKSLTRAHTTDKSQIGILMCGFLRGDSDLKLRL